MRRALAILGCLSMVMGCGARSLSAPPVSASPTPDSVAVIAVDPPQAPAVDGPSASGPWIGAVAANDALPPGSSNTFMAVWVDVPKVAQDQARSPAAVALVVDTSGSMAGDKIVHAREAAKKLVDGLADGDIVSLHSFGDVASTPVPPVRLDRRTRELLRGAIEELRPAGGTNLFEGVREAGKAAMSAPGSHAVRRVVLISDGNATVGTTSTEMIGFLGEKAADRNVQITSIGVGLDYNEAALNQLAMRSEGRLYHLSDSRELATIVSSEMGLLKSTRAADARIVIVPSEGTRLLGVEGMRSVRRRDDGSIEVPLGSLFAGQHREFIVRVAVLAPPTGPVALASVRLSYTDPTEGNLDRVQETVARADVVNDPAVIASRRNVKADGVLALIEASRASEEAVASLGADDFAGADRKLAASEARLMQAASAAKDDADKARITGNAERVRNARTSAARASEAPASARPAAKRKAVLESNDMSLDLMGF